MNTWRMRWTILATILGSGILFSINVSASEKTESPCGEIDIDQVEVPPDFLIEYRRSRMGRDFYLLSVNSEGIVICQEEWKSKNTVGAVKLSKLQLIKSIRRLLRVTSLL